MSFPRVEPAIQMDNIGNPCILHNRCSAPTAMAGLTMNKIGFRLVQLVNFAAKAKRKIIDIDRTLDMSGAILARRAHIKDDNFRRALDERLCLINADMADAIGF